MSCRRKFSRDLFHPTSSRCPLCSLFCINKFLTVLLFRRFGNACARLLERSHESNARAFEQLRTRPLGHSMRAVRESTARKRRIIVTEQSPAVSIMRMSQKVLPTKIALRAFYGRSNGRAGRIRRIFTTTQR